jgi:hypothetical protein
LLGADDTLSDSVVEATKGDPFNGLIDRLAPSPIEGVQRFAALSNFAKASLPLTALLSLIDDLGVSHMALILLTPFDSSSFSGIGSNFERRLSTVRSSLSSSEGIVATEPSKNDLRLCTSLISREPSVAVVSSVYLNLLL